MSKIINYQVNTSDNSKLDITIKNHKNLNDYFYTTSNLWIRNFAKKNCLPKDINYLYQKKEIDMLLKNEIENKKAHYTDFFTENFKYRKAIIISDGFGWDKNKFFIDDLPEDIAIITIHGACRFWTNDRLPNFYLLTNPYENSTNLFFPNEVFPFLIASNRASSRFLERWPNNKYTYNSTPDEYYESSVSKGSSFYVDEYRNAVAAAINLAYYMNVEDLALCYPIDAYKDYREGTTRYGDAFIYPQQQISASIIDGMLFWYRNNNPDCKIIYCGIDKILQFAAYVSEEEIVKVFHEQ